MGWPSAYVKSYGTGQGRATSLAYPTTMLDLLTTRRPITGAPRRLCRKVPLAPAETGKEVKEAA